MAELIDIEEHVHLVPNVYDHMYWRAAEPDLEKMDAAGWSDGSAVKGSDDGPVSTTSFSKGPLRVFWVQSHAYSTVRLVRSDA